MFTGLIQHVGRIAAIQRVTFGASLELDPNRWHHQPAAGESIAIDGCCLTLAERSTADRWCFDVIHQTLDATTLGRLKPQTRINLEHAVTPSTLMGGHIVQGHVDAIGTVVHVLSDGREHRVRIRSSADCMRLVVHRGSIAVNGVSLTVAETGADWFEVALIPSTLELTNLGDLRKGSMVNLETDYLAKIVANLVDRNNYKK